MSEEQENMDFDISEYFTEEELNEIYAEQEKEIEMPTHPLIFYVKKSEEVLMSVYYPESSYIIRTLKILDLICKDLSDKDSLTFEEVYRALVKCGASLCERDKEEAAEKYPELSELETPGSIGVIHLTDPDEYEHVFYCEAENHLNVSSSADEDKEERIAELQQWLSDHRYSVVSLDIQIARLHMDRELNFKDADGNIIPSYEYTYGFDPNNLEVSKYAEFLELLLGNQKIVISDEDMEKLEDLEAFE